MVWDLRGALLKKQENETARLADFAFRHRVRTMRLLAAALGRDADAFARAVVHRTDVAILADLASDDAADPAALDRLYLECQAEARRQLIDERGDPAPHRLA